MDCSVFPKSPSVLVPKANIHALTLAKQVQCNALYIKAIISKLTHHVTYHKQKHTTSAHYSIPHITIYHRHIYMYICTILTNTIVHVLCTHIYMYTCVSATCTCTSNLEREYRDCIKSRRDKIGITRHIIRHQVLYNVHVTLFIR